MISSRDLDSRITARESAAVHEWREDSNQPIHAMRDHPAHGTQLLAGMWDTDLRRKDARSRWKQAWKAMLKDPLIQGGKNGPDQILLTR